MARNLFCVKKCEIACTRKLGKQDKNNRLILKKLLIKTLISYETIVRELNYEDEYDTIFLYIMLKVKQ